MEKYENIEVVGEGSYGVVMKCRHKETGQVVAIKKFLESVENVHVRKLAFREIRMLKRLRHENLVSLIEVFRRKKRFYLVFEYLDHTILEELEMVGGGLGFEISRRHIFQVLRGLCFCHNNYIMHRDVKPENVLVSPRGVIKLCDFGFARIVTGPNESCTDYVATRWYRAPELLVGDPRYGRAVDTWAAGCLFAEMLSGEPIFAGDSDIDQLHRIVKLLGGLCNRHQVLMNRNQGSRNLRKACVEGMSYRSNMCNSAVVRSLRAILPSSNSVCIDFLAQCLRMDPDVRPTCAALLQHSMFQQESFADRFLEELRGHVAREAAENPLLHRRRGSLQCFDESPGLFATNEATRWQMKLINESSHAISEKSIVCPPMAVSGQQPPEPSNQQQQRDRQKATAAAAAPHLQRPREFSYIGPSSVAPNVTYIRRLEHKGLLPTLDCRSTKGFVLPALASREHQRQQGTKAASFKRSKIDAPSYCA